MGAPPDCTQRSIPVRLSTQRYRRTPDIKGRILEQVLLVSPSAIAYGAGGKLFPPLHYGAMDRSEGSPPACPRTDERDSAGPCRYCSVDSTGAHMQAYLTGDGRLLFDGDGRLLSGSSPDDAAYSMSSAEGRQSAGQVERDAAQARKQTVPVSLKVRVNESATTVSPVMISSDFNDSGFEEGVVRRAQGYEYDEHDGETTEYTIALRFEPEWERATSEPGPTPDTRFV